VWAPPPTAGSTSHCLPGKTALGTKLDAADGFAVLVRLLSKAKRLNAASRRPGLSSISHRLPLWTQTVFRIAELQLRPRHCACRSASKDGAGMSREKAAVYRLHAAHCTELPQRNSDPKGRLSLCEMSRAWLRLAELSEAEQSALAIARPCA
jgi:hypothetical protein